jgi:RNA polymerase sigma-70 factor (ECF subfamily)
MSELDGALVARCLNGEWEAYGELVRRYERPLYNAALRIVGDSDDAEDIVQGVFVKAYEKLDTYDSKRKFFSWIYRMMVNASINILDSRRPRVDLDPDLPSPGDSPETEYVRGEVSRQVEEALSKLKPEYRMAVVLKYFGDLSYEELGYVLELPTKTVKSRLYEARRMLSALVSGAGVTHG